MKISAAGLAPRRSPVVWRRLVGGILLGFVGLYLLLLVPERQSPCPAGAGKAPFRWDRDAYWQDLETQFRQQKALGCDENGAALERRLAQLQVELGALALTNLPPAGSEFDSLETHFFQLAPMIGACPGRLPEYLSVFAAMRSLVKRQSWSWSMDAREARDQLYRLLYGGRAAVEEAILQAPRGDVSPLLRGEDGLSATPSAEVADMVLHSGDILVSRGGAATSALIARGNDFPGNFSHVALVHVDELTHDVSVIESHIESGVGVFPIGRYLVDTKLRIMVLRPRADLPAILDDPQLPHKAAAWAMAEAGRRHIPYDFSMDFDDPSKQFCSEVASSAYRRFGVTLWMQMSHLSTPGVTAWLWSLGVRHFKTQEPSDLEYDPQLCVVAEWRDPQSLFKDHVDNAVIDAMLERAEAGEKLGYNHWMLPVVRGLKAWSMLKNWFGGVGPVPEGMSATTALRVDQFTKRHKLSATRVMARAERFRADHGYMPPYWELVRLAREALSRRQ